MLKFLPAILIFAMLFCQGFSVMAQDSTGSSGSFIGPEYLETIASQSNSLQTRLDKKSEKILSRFQDKERKILRKLERIDSSKAASLFSDLDEKYKQLDQKIQATQGTVYIPKIDTMITSLKFLDQHPGLMAGAELYKGKLSESLDKVRALKEGFSKAETIKMFLKERKQFLKDQVSKFGFSRELKKLNKEAYYYAQQINEYKEILKDSKKAERKALELLSRTKLFKDFMRKNSQLASLFRLPGNPDDPSSQASLAGLQTRVQVTQLIQDQLTAGGPAAREQFQQNVQAAQAQLNQLKDKVLKFGGGSSDKEVPDFKPNNQKTKSFLQKLEFGTNIQSTKANSIFPVTSDIGLSVGYKINDNSIIGIGSSFKMGWGRDIRHIRISSQGVGLRSFLDYKIKGSLWISGGFEMNYRSEIREIALLKDYAAWQQSGLLGLSKVVSLKTKVFRKTKLQLLWDFLGYRQVPRAHPIIFRISYAFK